MPLRLMLAALLAMSALGLGMVAWQATRPAAIVSAPSVEMPAPLVVNVLVAAHAVPAGTLIKDEDLAPKALPAASVSKAQLVDTPEIRTSLRGALLRRWLDAGDPILPNDLLRPRDRGFLAAVLAPGKRAIAVGVDAVTGTGGLIWPGDRVDVVLTQELKEANTPLGRRVVGETVLADVRVVAVDQSITQSAGAEAATGKVARTVTLEVSPEQAARAAVAQQLGRLTLTLRAAEELAVAPSRQPGAIYSADVSNALGEKPAAAPAPHMRIIQGTDNREYTFQ